MESPGEHLKREREHRGVSLQKIFESTRVPLKYLEAIEEDRVEGLPQPAFVKGYIRNYCKVLGLDENDAVLRYEVWLADRAAEAEAAGKPKPVQELKKKRLSAASEKPEREFKAPPYLGKVAVVAAGIIIVILAYALMRRDLSAPEKPMVAAEPAAVEMAPIEPSVSPQPPAPAPAEAPATVQAPKPQQPAASGVPMMLAPAPQTAKPAPQQPQPAKPQAAAPQPFQKAVPPAEPAKAAPAEGALKEEPVKTHTLIANAKETVWMKVGVDKEEPVEVLLREGERFTWKASENISVVVGNAGGVTLTYNGKDISGLGASGEVVGVRFPSGTSYKIKTPAALPERPAEPAMPPAVNMPQVPDLPQSHPEGGGR